MEYFECLETIKTLRDGILPSRNTTISIVSEAMNIFQEEPNLIFLNGNTYVFGDIHGQFYDMLNMIDSLDSSYNVVFLGDYVDRGYNSVETFLYIILLKLIGKEKIILIRGNHENRAQTAAYGFKEECIRKYDEVIYWMICDLFMILPVSAIINQKYFCIHGGIIPELRLEDINNSDRIEEFSTIGNVLWGDPCNDIQMFKQSQRGAGFLFGSQAVASQKNL